MTGRTSTYAEAIRGQVAMLSRCDGFIECTKIEIFRPCDQNVNERGNNSGHEPFHFLVSKTITTLY